MDQERWEYWLTLIIRRAAFFYLLCHDSVQCGFLVKQYESHFRAKNFHYSVFFYCCKAILWLVAQNVWYYTIRLLFKTNTLYIKICSDQNASRRICVVRDPYYRFLPHLKYSQWGCYKMMIWTCEHLRRIYSEIRTMEHSAGASVTDCCFAINTARRALWVADGPWLVFSIALNPCCVWHAVTARV